MLQARDPMRRMNFFNLPNASGCTRPLGFTQPRTEMSTRSRKIMFLGSKAWMMRRADNLPVSRFSRQCGILNISQPYRLPQPVMGIALLFLYTYILSTLGVIMKMLLGAPAMVQPSYFSCSILKVPTYFIALFQLRAIAIVWPSLGTPCDISRSRFGNVAMNFLFNTVRNVYLTGYPHHFNTNLWTY
jgi:hypothetical protein